MKLGRWIILGLFGISILSIASLFIPGFYFPFFLFLFFPPFIFKGFGSNNQDPEYQRNNYLETKPPGPKYCDNCGMRITKQWNYCPNCSNPLEIDTNQYR